MKPTSNQQTLYLVEFRHERLSCCPPGAKYYSVKKREVLADSPEHAIELTVQANSPSGRVEIKSVKDLSE
jgi:hypothetical protein